jgi:hypothetical protein
MATVMNSHHSHHLTSPRTLTQKVCIGLGLFFVLAGIGGIVMPGMLGMHLSLLHNIIHLASGALALLCGYADDPRKAFNFSVAFGLVYGLLGLGGFVFGEPGYPGVGHMEADNYLLRVIPNALEFGTADHAVHIIIAAAFILSAYAWKRKSAEISKTAVNVQGRTEVFKMTTNEEDVDLLNSERNLKDADLGRSDVNRFTDVQRREDFERRV